MELNYMVCATPRCGSSYLCELLKGTGRLGRPSEFFGKAKAIDKFKARHGVNSSDQRVIAEAVSKIRRGKNGVFGVKCHFKQFDSVLRSFNWADVFPGTKFILLEREDILMQAISLSKAKQTGAWSSNRELSVKPSYSFASIYDSLLYCSREKSAWEAVFKVLGLRPYRVLYEDLVARPIATVEAVASFIGVDVAVGDDVFAAVKHQKQRDDESIEWADRFKSELKAFALSRD